ncbi:MAG: tRNA (guanosine(37)-N1)-methyltransferase TrmD [Spirochaetales bacterium]|nr:tRNA (guanosine(37)-N1)-methyltransferase TrmD [Spirochaetales bacterium]
MEIFVLTLFPERYRHYTEYGLPQKALKKGLFSIQPVYLPDFADPARKGRIDDTPYGGGPGMVVQVGPVDRALASIGRDYPVVLLTPRGEPFRQSLAEGFARLPGIVLVCGYYEGVDERIASHLVTEKLSLGDFVLGSGDLAALCVIEATTRLLPEYMGSEESAIVESREDYVEYPQYSRPADYRGWKVPEVLLSGDHGRIAAWRAEQSRNALAEKEKRAWGTGGRIQYE